MAPTECKFEDKIIEMHGDIKTLVTEFKNMNGSLKGYKEDFEHHKEDSVGYRKKIDMVWAIVHSVKWVIIFLFGTGVLYKWIR